MIKSNLISCSSLSSFFQRNFLSFVVFVTGACVLIIEVVATRILSPYFGNTIYTVSSVISIILLGLSMGYYLGGRFADTHPSKKWFYAIILVSGFSVFFLQLLTSSLLPILGYQLTIVNGPLITSLLLFFLPSFFLGTLSPFAIKIQESDYANEGIGKITGNIFFWSTFGSIFGSLSAGFYMIPQFGINQIVSFVGTALILLGILGLITTKNKIKKIPIALLFLITLFAILNSDKPAVKTIYSKDGVYEKIQIYDGVYNGKPTRFFMQDKSYSGAMFLDSDDLVFDYTKYYAIYKILNPDIKNTLVIGGGAYSIPKALLKENQDIKVDVAEIEPSLFELGKKYFKVPDDKRLTNYTEDGRRLLVDGKKNYDLIFSDVYYSLYSIPAHFTTREFFALARDKLNNKGIFIANLIGSLSRQNPSLIFSEIKTFRSIFPNSYFFATTNPNDINLQNIIMVGYKNERIIGFNTPEIKNNPNPILSSLDKKLINLNRFDLSQNQILSDNFSPVEYLTAKTINTDLNLTEGFNGNEALSIISQQLNYGPRFPGSSGHKKMQEFLIAEMKILTSMEITQNIDYIYPEIKKNGLKNIIGRFFPEKRQRIILGTHYDSKKFANKDTSHPKDPMPGANDSASGVAILVETARLLANKSVKPKVGIDIVFFDGEEGDANLPDSEWKPIGSTYFAEKANNIYSNKKPVQAIILDMVCDKDLNIYEDYNSLEFAKRETQKFFQIAHSGYPSNFYNYPKWEIDDDHTPLNKIGIPSFLVIDFDYPYFHTTQDTIDKCSAESLKKVGDSLFNYIYTL
ncbi:MAG: hypothetical protein A2857_03995 [Candidatus Levybacteria bacterium RIFCSPHIGHO2_01_FULL_36_15]|nr:MAG: hypothetical protein A2857_03995 [Candidatus Levybacteria bacterium RIFCSPHIGHO2_01_FULL_36_15]OGH39175.1 MAG: hypothetical protein A2905_03085 [Candidatus Levybacteria bacterium RIFCSPLOWO2_01_FULL_36_10]